MNALKPATPLPYHVEDDTDIYSVGGFFVATTFVPESAVGTRIEYEHAAYIVAACNAYPQLVDDRARLVEALHEIDILGNGIVDSKDQTAYVDLMRCGTIARAALRGKK